MSVLFISWLFEIAGIEDAAICSFVGCSPDSWMLILECFGGLPISDPNSVWFPIFDYFLTAN